MSFQEKNLAELITVWQRMDCGIRVYTDKNLDFTDLIAPIVTALAKNIIFAFI